MAASASAAYAIYPDRVALNDVLQTLGRGGFDKESICMMLSPTHPIATIVRESSTHSFEREANAVTAGWIGWLSELGAVVIPSFGFFIRSREFFRTLVTDRGVAPCGSEGTLAALGFSDENAERVENEVREAGVFLYVSCPEASQTQWALELLRASGAEDSGLLQPGAAMAVAAAG